MTGFEAAAQHGNRDANSPRICAAFVPANSISQREEIGILGSKLFQRYHFKIQFADRTFP
jgi:hypothetical protein